jgi:hypothetical protein
MFLAILGVNQSLIRRQNPLFGPFWGFGGSWPGGGFGVRTPTGVGVLGGPGGVRVGVPKRGPGREGGFGVPGGRIQKGDPGGGSVFGIRLKPHAWDAGPGGGSKKNSKGRGVRKKPFRALLYTAVYI